MNLVTINRALMVLAWAGVFVAGVLSIAHAMNLSIPCGASSDCNALARDPSSKWFGVPVAYFGLGAYLCLALLAAGRAWLGLAKGRSLVVFGFLVSMLGTVISVYLTLYAINTLKLHCYWCISSAVIMSLGFVLHGVLLQKSPMETEAATADWVVFSGAMMVAIGLTVVRVQSIAGQSGVKLIAPEQAPKVTLETMLGPTVHTKGPADAKITIIEFADALCGVCRDQYPVLKSLYEQADGRIRIAFRHYPLFNKEGHETSLTAAMISEYAATEGKFWDYIDAVFQGPEEKVKSVTGLVDLAASVGLDRSKAAAVIDPPDEKLLDIVNSDFSKAQEVGVDRTPTFFVFAEGLRPVNVIGAGIESLLARPEYAKLWRKGGPAK